ncbi:HAMP domain-containing histidine kinase [Ottowia sp. GY511]|uniref:histidine kinase n=1 Tax=Ottowia flava TaxID=2675430 RepID=A0ABW4KPI5_9BURK|nr:HAMP domain-containing sensor histidine kinase [Ottowia sp. GY511]TXK27775.1 HAMP domain-containing histidine kinase [Ottowia sp. GY511]
MRPVIPTAAITVPVDPSKEADWLEAASYNAFFSSMSGAQLSALMMAAILVMLSYEHVPAGVLLVWSSLAMVDVVWRSTVRKHYERLVRGHSMEEQLNYARKQEPLWVFNGMFWGLTPLGLFSYLPATDALIAWLPVIAGGIGRTSYLAPHLRSARIYLVVFAACLALSVAVELVVGLYDPLGPRRWWMPVALVLYVLLLARLIRVHHARHAQVIDLLYQNQLLIQSLREQTRAARSGAEFRTRFLAGAAHDLKQPISALGIYAEWLGSEPRLVEELAPKILQATQAINSLFDSLFDLAKLDVDHLQLNLRPLNVGALLKDLLVQYRPLAVQKGLVLRARSIDAVILTDSIILRRILGNLISNAIRYTSHGGVLLGVRRCQGSLLFEVWDTGMGIAADQHAHIFGEFYKVPQGGTEDGFGLGLSLVRRLAALMDYPITLRSRLAKGTVFRLQVPLSEPAPESQRLTGSTDHGGARSGASASGT